MAFLNDSKLIVMLTDLKSEKNFQCYKYYPTSQENITFEDYSINLINEEIL